MIARRTLTILLCLAGLLLLGSSFYMQMKAELAQMLIGHSWYQRSEMEPPAVPWPWADTRAVALLEIPSLDIKQFIMQDASGESLAFGPGLVTANTLPATGSHSMIAGHRDSHFDFIPKVLVGTRFRVSNYRGQSQLYQVVEQRVLDTQKEQLQLNSEQNLLTLITCFPFDGLIVGGPLRWIVNAQAI